MVLSETDVGDGMADTAKQESRLPGMTMVMR